MDNSNEKETTTNSTESFSESSSISSASSNSLQVTDANLRIKFDDGSEVDVSNPDHFLSNLLEEVESLRKKVLDEKLKQEIDRQANLINYLRSLDDESVREMTTSIQPATLIGMKKLVDHTLSTLGLEAIVKSGILKHDNNEEENNEDITSNVKIKTNINDNEDKYNQDIKDETYSSSSNLGYTVSGQKIQDGSFRIQDIPPAGYQGKFTSSTNTNIQNTTTPDEEDDNYSPEGNSTTLDKQSNQKQVVILSQSREAMLQIFTWQIINGYFLRELEQQQQVVEARQRTFNAKKDAMMKDMKNIAQYQEKQAQQAQDQDSALGAINEMLSNGAKTEEAQQLMILKQKLQERLREQLLAMEKAMEEEEKRNNPNKEQNEDGEENGKDDDTDTKGEK